MNTIANFEMIDIDILVEYNLYSIIFAKEKLKLNDEKTTLLVNLLYSLVSHNSKPHIIKNDSLGPQEIKPGDYIKSLYKDKNVDIFAEENSKLKLREKTITSDIEHFTTVVNNVCSHNPP